MFVFASRNLWFYANLFCELGGDALRLDINLASHSVNGASFLIPTMSNVRFALYCAQFN